jgi:hypothetical protein
MCVNDYCSTIGKHPIWNNSLASEKLYGSNEPSLDIISLIIVVTSSDIGTGSLPYAAETTERPRTALYRL